MAAIQPFRALLPDPARAADICELPYDVMSTAEARQMAKGRPDSFLHVSRPEIDLAHGTATNDPSVYAKARENFDRMIAAGVLMGATRLFEIWAGTQSGSTTAGRTARHQNHSTAHTTPKMGCRW